MRKRPVLYIMPIFLDTKSRENKAKIKVRFEYLTVNMAN